MEKISPVGLDLAKSVLQVHAIAETGEVLIRRSLRRTQVLAFFIELPHRVPRSLFANTFFRFNASDR